MANEEEYWEATFPDGTYVSGIYPTLKIERQALQQVSRSAKRDPLLAMKESQENLIRLCVRQIGEDAVNYADLRESKLEQYFDAKQIYMITELFESWQTPERGDVESFLGSVKMGSRTRPGPKKSGSRSESEPSTES